LFVTTAIASNVYDRLVASDVMRERAEREKPGKDIEER